MQKLCGGTEHHRSVGRARKESSAAEPEGLPCTNSIKLSMSQFTKFLKEQMPLKCKISSTVCCGSLQKVPWGRGQHGAMPGLSLGVAGEQQGAAGQSSQAPNGQRTEKHHREFKVCRGICQSQQPSLSTKSSTCMP